MAKIAGATGILVATFALGFWLTSPSFPLGQQFVAVSLNGEPVISNRSGVKLPTLEVWRVPFSPLHARGTAHCNGWGGEVVLMPLNFVVWRTVYVTAVACAGLELENRYLRALLGARRWRIENGALILYNGRDTLRFLLASA